MLREKLVGIDELVGNLKPVLLVHQMRSQLMVPKLRLVSGPDTAMNCVYLDYVVVGSHNDSRASFFHIVMGHVV